MVTGFISQDSEMVAEKLLQGMAAGSCPDLSPTQAQPVHWPSAPCTAHFAIYLLQPITGYRLSGHSLGLRRSINKA